MSVLFSAEGHHSSRGRSQATLVRHLIVITLRHRLHIFTRIFLSLCINKYIIILKGTDGFRFNKKYTKDAAAEEMMLFLRKLQTLILKQYLKNMMYYIDVKCVFLLVAF